MKLGIWNKPNSNEVRVYFNGVADYLQSYDWSKQVKVFAVETDNDRFEIKFSANLPTSEKDRALDSIGDELDEMNGGERVIRWSDLKKLAN